MYEASPVPSGKQNHKSAVATEFTTLYGFLNMSGAERDTLSHSPLKTKGVTH
jgi:hypothetical protein